MANISLDDGISDTDKHREEAMSPRQYTFSLAAKSPLLSPSFTFGVATSSYQIEGAVDVDDRLPSIWDTFCATPDKVKNGDSGATACDHYHRVESDLDLLVDLGVDAYRFSLSWPRLIKQDGSLNIKGVDFYKRILEGLRERSISPYVTLYHWDLPQHLQDRGGWLNRDIAYRFSDYVDVVTRELADHVSSFATINEPWCVAFLGHGFGNHAPGITGMRNARQASHHVLLAHGLAMQVLKVNSPTTKNGIVLNMAPVTPKTHRYDDVIIAKMAEADGNHWFLQPILQGAYPEIITHTYPEQVPLILDKDMQIISQPIDFLGVNYYTRQICSYNKKGEIYFQKNTEGEYTDFDWEIYPQGLTDLLVDLDNQYNLPEIMITENGASGTVDIVDGKVSDNQRCRYFQSHLQAVDNAIQKGVRITGYFAWSLLDNFEWAEGYSKRFGIYHVDFATQKRTPKSSALAFRHLLKYTRSSVDNNTIAS